MLKKFSEMMEKLVRILDIFFDRLLYMIRNTHSFSFQLSLQMIKYEMTETILD